MSKSLGKNQSYCREINFELVIDLLRKESRSATQLADILGLSNATMSSIIKALLDLKMIEVAKSASIKGSGRKQVFYTLNSKFGLILVVNIAHRKADISITNIKEENIAYASMPIAGLDDKNVQEVILKANELLFNCHNEAPLKNIVISISGLVKDKTEGNEKHFVQTAFEKQFHNVPTYLTNDGNLITYGELSKGLFSKEIRNGIVVLLDYGIGGAFVIDKELYKADNGFSGEFGHLVCIKDNHLEFIEDVISLRCLLEEAEKIVHKELKIEELIELFKTNPEIHRLVIESATVLGESLRSLIDVTDITNVVIAGRVTHFGDEYLEEVRSKTNKTISKSNVIFSSLNNKGQMIGGAFIGVDYILKKSLEK